MLTMMVGAFPLSAAAAEAEPGLMFRDIVIEKNDYVESTGDLRSINEIEFALNTYHLIRLYYGTPDSYVAVTDINVISGNSVVLGKRILTDGKPSVRVACVDVGQSVLEFSYPSGDTTKTSTFTLNIKPPSISFHTSQERSEETRCFHGVINWLDLTDSTVWCLHEDGFTKAEQSEIEVTVTRNNQAVSGFEYEWVKRPNAANVYDLKIILPKPPENGFQLDVTKGSKNLCSSTVKPIMKYINQYIGDDIVVGFTYYDDDVFYVVGDQCSTSGIISNRLPQESDPYMPFGTSGKFGKEIAAAYISKDNKGAYVFTKIENGKASVTVNKVWIDHVDGVPEAFSLDDRTHITELNGPFDSSDLPQLYYKSGVHGRIYLCADIEATVGNKTVSGMVRFSCKSSYSVPNNAVYDCEELGIRTVDDLNSLLKSIADSLDPFVDDSVDYKVILADTDYSGTVQIPDAFGGNNKISLIGSTEGTTRLVGSIDLNKLRTGVSSIRNITFIAPQNEGRGETRAVYNGTTGIKECVFYGYDVALDTTSAGLLTADNCVFINNGIASRVDVGTLNTGMFNNMSKSNTFLNNGTAVQILSLNKFVSPYYFRIYDSNFINNGTDIDARCGGTLYFYRNYFGEYKDTGNGHIPKPGVPGLDKHNGPEDLRIAMLLAAKTETKVGNMLHHRPPKLHTENSTRVITNPRWKYPVLNWWTGVSLETLITERHNAVMPVMLMAEKPYENILIADWELSTVIDNTEAGDLLIDDSAFGETDGSEKKVDVVDSNEKNLGSWIFD